MAVRYDVPGIGTVESDNAASDDTLRAILAEISKDSAKNKKSQKADEDAANAANTKAKADQEGAKVGKNFNTSWSAAGASSIKALKDIGLTAVSMAAKFGTDFVNIAENPIKETANMLNTLIDAGTQVATSFLDLMGPLGKFASSLLNAAAELAKAANKTFAEQLQRNIDTLQAYNKVGVSFVGSMDQMTTIAHGAGLGLVDFSKIVSKSKNDLNYLGMSGGAAALALSNGMGLTTKLIGKSGQTLRNEMFKLGYNYEEQGEVMASYMANMKASGKLESMSREDLARGTRQYAADLKVVADFTGQDAKKLAERARQAQLNVAVQQNLDEKQRERLGQASQMLARMGPEGERAQQALTQMLLRGATNVQGYTMGPGREMIETMMKNVKSGQEDVFQNAGRAMSKAQEATSKDMTQGAVAVAKAFGVAGEASDGIASFQAGLFAMGKIGPEMVSNMRNANEKQATAANLLADETAKLYAQTKQHQVTMEKLVNPELGRYAKLLKETNDLLQGNFMDFLKGVADGAKNTSNKDSIWSKKAKQPPATFPDADKVPKAPIREPYDLNKKLKEILLPPDSKFGVPPSQPVKKYAKGGKVSSGDIGIAGEQGPELISGPASVLSTASTESLIIAIDAMREMQGTRLGENGFDWNVGMNEGRMATLKDRMKGFEGVNYTQLQSELSQRPEMSAMAKAKAAMDDTPDTASSALAEQMGELVRLMKQSVDQTTRVAMNTN